MAIWYKHDIAAWMEGTEGLPDGLYRVYHVVCQLMYLNDGPIHNHEHGIAGRCNQHILKFRKNIAELVQMGKLRIEGGKLHNVRAEKEISSMLAARKPKRNPMAPPPATSVTPPPIPPQLLPPVPNGVGGEGLASKSLKNNKTIRTVNSVEESRGEKRREEKNQETAIAAPEVQKAPDARVFSRGREVLGKQAGGLIKKLIDAREKNYALCIADLETASTKHSPAEWIGKIISNRTEDRYANLDPRAFGGKML